jgi:heme/copper-type cytochrome/quinol oxidase subunit 4
MMAIETIVYVLAVILGGIAFWLVFFKAGR